MCNCENKTPPLGLRPTEVWLSMREGEILQAMKRYRDAGKDIPMKWIDELIGIDAAIDSIREETF